MEKGNKKKDEKKLFVVIRCIDAEQAIRNASIAKEAGAHGIFLVGHGGMPAPRLLEIYKRVREHLPGFWIGLNFLDLSAQWAMDELPLGVQALWVGSVGISKSARQPVLVAQNNWHSWLKKKTKQREWGMIYFAGVAERHLRDLAWIAREATRFCDVIIISSEGTDQYSLEKIQIIHEAIEGSPLAFVGSLTQKSLGLFAPFVDFFLVDTGSPEIKSLNEIKEMVQSLLE